MTKEQEIAMVIGQYYLKKNDGDYTATQAEVEKLRITSIRSLGPGEGIEITLSRPGLLIGRRGAEIEALSQFLGMKVKIVECRDHWLDWLVPVDYSHEFY